MKIPQVRVITGLLVFWCAVIFAWAILTVAAADCPADDPYQAACITGSGIGILLIFLIGFFGFAFLSIIWFMTRPQSRPCPRCGEAIRAGTMRCHRCGFDFSAVGRH